MKKKFIKTLTLGILSWAIPFLISFLFYNQNKELIIGYELFKSIMVLVSSLSGIVLIAFYTKSYHNCSVWECALVGSLWFLVNVLLDTFILLPMSNIDSGTYINSIAIRYLVIPVTFTGVGYIFNKRSKSNA